MRRPQSDGWTRFYVPEIHDVHPGMQDRLDRLFGIWPQPARRVAALLVVPNWMGTHDLAGDPAFCGRIAALPNEKVLHGWTHSLGPDFLNWLLYGHDNRSEFASLGEAEAQARIAPGLDSLKRNLGIVPRWFCAPRWQQGRAVEPVLRAAGFEGYMLNDRLKLLAGLEVPMPSLCFDEGERRLRSAVARSLREGAISRLMAQGRPFRFTLHPADLDDGKTWDQVRRLSERLDAEGWQPLAINEAVARWQASQAQPESLVSA